MDPITQMLLGAAVGHATLGARVGRKALFWGAVIGGLPDLDVLIPQADVVAEVTNHRGFSHSLITHSLVAPIMGAGLARLHAKDGVSALPWAMLAWFALATHALLDATTIYGTQLFWPSKGPPIGLGSNFIIDPLFTLLLLVGVLCAGFSGRRIYSGLRANRIFLGLGSTYLVLSILIQAHVQNLAETELVRQDSEYLHLIATPTPFNIVLWRIIAMTPDGYFEGYHSLLDQSPEIQFAFFPSEKSLLKAIEDSQSVKRLQWFTKGYYRVREMQGRIEIADLRMGYEPRYVFSFAVGKQQEGIIEPLLPPLRLPAERPDGETLKWVWQRLLGKT